jgi:predicted Zn-dependent protease
MRAFGPGRRPPPLAQALLALAVGAACAVNPVTGRRELSFMSVEREAALGSQAARAVAEEIGIVEGGAAAYVRAIGERIAAVSPRTDVTYRFYVADMPEPNAFALPGGYVYVSRGLLALTNSEDELAAVIGHEVGHVAARHAAQRETRATSLGVLSLLGTVAAGVFGGSYAAQAANQLGQVAGAGLIAAYSRDQERQADRVGQEMTARAGWDPAAMSSFLRTLDRYTQLDERAGHRRPSFFDSHPMTPERVETTAALARRLGRRAPGTQIAASRAGFLARIEGTVVGGDPAQGVLSGDRFLHPDLDFHLLLPAGWEAENSRAALGALALRGEAFLTLALEGGGSDPAAAARTFLQANRLRPIAAEPLRIGGLGAYRAVAPATTRGGPVGLHLTWIAHRNRIFRITGAAPIRLFDAHVAAFDRTAGSFGALTAEERRSIRVRLLHAATSRDGESLTALGDRVGNTWTAAETAAANELADGVRLAAGQLVKVVVARPYASRP